VLVFHHVSSSCARRSAIRPAEVRRFSSSSSSRRAYVWGCREEDEGDQAGDVVQEGRQVRGVVLRGAFLRLPLALAVWLS
jgi:hypothetical protein